MNTSPPSSELNNDNSARRGKPSRTRVHFLSHSRLYSYETYLNDDDCWYSQSDELGFKLCARDEALRFMLVSHNAGPINTGGMCIFGLERAICQVSSNESRRAIVRAVMTEQRRQDIPDTSKCARIALTSIRHSERDASIAREIGSFHAATAVESNVCP